MNKLATKIFIISAGALAFLAFITQQALAQSTGAMGYHGWEYGSGWGHMMFGFVMMVLFFGGIVLVIVLVVRWLGGSSTSKFPSSNERTALDILNERYARGDIEKEEYEERKRILSD